MQRRIFEWYARILNAVGLKRYVEITVPELAHESENFVLIEWRDQGVWLPKAQIKIRPEQGKVFLQVPRMLANKMERMAK